MEQVSQDREIGRAQMRDSQPNARNLELKQNAELKVNSKSKPRQSRSTKNSKCEEVILLKKMQEKSKVEQITDVSLVRDLKK